MTNVIPIRRRDRTHPHRDADPTPVTPAAEPAPRDPIQVQVTRYRCPTCNRLCSNRSRAREHMSRCWWDPANRGCKTCVHFDRRYDEDGDGCHKGVDLTGRPGCARCGGGGLLFAGGGASECGDCGGDAVEVKPGPIINCNLWQLRPDLAEDEES